MPWGRVYILGDWFYHMDVRFHEWAHLEQIKREGALLFSARYLWLTIRHGYWNAYELEALDFERRSIAELRKLNGTLAYAA